MSNKELVSKLVELIGGASNIATETHCMTRLRIDVKDIHMILIKEKQ